MLIERSKGDEEGEGQEVAIPRGYRLAHSLWHCLADPPYLAFGAFR